MNYKVVGGLWGWLAGEAALVPIWVLYVALQMLGSDCLCLKRAILPESACGSGSCYSLLGICDFYLPISKFCEIAFPVQVYCGLNKNVYPVEEIS